MFLFPLRLAAVSSSFSSLFARHSFLFKKIKDVLVRLRRTLLYGVCNFSNKPRNVTGHETEDNYTTSAMQAASARTYQALFYQSFKTGRKTSPFQVDGTV